MAVSEAKLRHKRVSAHARSCESVKQCVRHGIEIIYHASFADEEALDMLEAHKDRTSSRPASRGSSIRRIHAASGASRPSREADGLSPRARDRDETLKKMHKRGIRILPGGDYGFAWIKHGTNAKDLEYFVKYLGFTPMEALLAATQLGGEIMMRGRRTSGRSRKASSPICCWSTAIRSPTSRCYRIGSGCWR
jgi:imidazolonepropionase-like amidohydrolase